MMNVSFLNQCKKAALGVMAICVLMFANPVMAADITLDAAKSQGLVGERLDGYLDVVGNETPQLRALVQSTNQARREAYMAIAQKTNQPLSVVQKLAAKKAYEKTPAGYYVQGQNGQWRKR